MSNFSYGEKSKKLLKQNMHQLVYLFMKDVLKESRYDISIIDGARTIDDQIKLYQDGKTELDGINDLSDHQIEKYGDNLGRAIDFIPYVPNLKLNIWEVNNHTTNLIWSECFRAILRVDRLWKQKGIDVGIELGWTYNIGGGRDYPHIGFKKL